MRKFIRQLVAKLRPSSEPNKAEIQRPTAGYKDVVPTSTGQHSANQHQEQVVSNMTPETLTVALQNRTNSPNVYAYITGLAINNNYAPVFVQADGRTIYFPTSPSQPLSPLAQDVAIPLGAPGNTVHATIPRIAGGRIWFSVDARLTFYINPGPAVVEPSVTNPTDANINVNWSFCEFTFNDAQLFANISYVDFVSVPVSLSLTNGAGHTQTVPGMSPNGFTTVVNELRAQASRDRRPWDQLIHSHNGRPLRALSPNNLLVGNANAWGDYWDGYIQQVWSRFTNQDMIINTQAAAGNLRGRVVNGELTFPSAGSFSRPTAKDIFSCSTGPFATGPNPARNAVIPRLAAAFNRSTLLLAPDQFPNGSHPGDYYKNGVTNHYSRIVHSVQRDGRGYGFPYDDVVPDGGSDVAGTVFDGNPRLFTVAVGGG